MKSNSLIPTIKAVNPKHQKLVNRCVSWLYKHNEFDNLRNDADGDGDEKAYKKWDNKCIYTFDKYLEYAEELPQRELDRIDKLIYG